MLIAKSTPAKIVIFLFSNIFPIFWNAKILETDDGALFQGDQFVQWATYTGFTFMMWSKANRETEKFMRTANKTRRATMSFLKTYKYLYSKNKSLFLRT